MADDTEQAVERQSNPQAIKSPDFRSVYANGARLRYSTWDITIGFTRSIDTGEGIIASEALIEITCSPAHMKAVAGALNEAVRAYEERFGAINPTMAADPELFNRMVEEVPFPTRKG
jgi:hypothetical protein